MYIQLIRLVEVNRSDGIQGIAGTCLYEAELEDF